MSSASSFQLLNYCIMNAIARFKRELTRRKDICAYIQYKVRKEERIIITNFTVILRSFFHIYLEASNLKIKLYAKSR